MTPRDDMNFQAPQIPSKEELIRSLLATRDRLAAEGVVTVQDDGAASQPVEAAPQPAAMPEVSSSEAPTAQAAPASVQTTDASEVLNHPEVQDGLEQLLSEWDLFKSSGLFGFGAGGLKHPTYEKLAPLPVSAVLAGRWEGADPKVIENIQEYMNSWKREQGVVVDPSETFETYLRRVIADILNLSK